MSCSTSIFRSRSSASFFLFGLLCHPEAYAFGQLLSTEQVTFFSRFFMYASCFSRSRAWRIGDNTAGWLSGLSYGHRPTRVVYEREEHRLGIICETIEILQILARNEPHFTDPEETTKNRAVSVSQGVPAPSGGSVGQQPLRRKKTHRYISIALFPHQHTSGLYKKNPSLRTKLRCHSNEATGTAGRGGGLSWSRTASTRAPC